MEGVRGEFLDHDLLAAEVDGLAGRAGTRQRLELADAEVALVHGGDEFGADSAGYTDNGYNGIIRHVRIPFGLQTIKKPRSFSGGASVQMMRSFDYARTAPEPPEGALVFAVRLVVAFMGRSYEGARRRRQRVLGLKYPQRG